MGIEKPEGRSSLGLKTGFRASFGQGFWGDETVMSGIPDLEGLAIALVEGDNHDGNIIPSPLIFSGIHEFLSGFVTGELQLQIRADRLSREFLGQPITTEQ